MDCNKRNNHFSPEGKLPYANLLAIGLCAELFEFLEILRVDLTHGWGCFWSVLDRTTSRGRHENVDICTCPE
eukprot:1342590-Amorphochlora_amoeboformis.AAC.1